MTGLIRDVTTEFVRRHYANGPTAYNQDGSIAKMPSPDDVTYCEQQFDRWLADMLRQEREKGHAEALRAYADTLGVDANEEHDGDEWWAGYRQAQREFITRTERAADQASNVVRPEDA